ncbi:PLP-dependent aspartate aminotransferase family protein [Cytophagaceae bacterium ABcell3]|nr:PLP-dependent aspartate aminotransferase family protein [Cytophagaceae bacterium ABcell3]
MFFFVYTSYGSNLVPMDLSQILFQLGEENEHYFNAVAPPIVQTSNFSFKTVAEMRQAQLTEYDTHFYTRGNNPVVEMVRKKMAALEGAEDALVLASGSAAISVAVLSNLQHGDHIISVYAPYSWTNKFLTAFLPRFGITVTMVDGTDISNFKEAIRPETKVIFLESPNSYTFVLQDIAQVSLLAKEHNITTILDNSYAGPLFQNPIKMGVDIVVHSATKYIGGHSDAMGGVICGRSDMMRKIFASEYMTLGGVISPFNAWLLLRGLRTLEVRMDRIADSAAKVTAFLQQHKAVESVRYPFLPTHPQYDLAKKQMKKCPGLFTIALKASTVDDVELFCNTLKRFALACSWGGYESLIFPACATFEERDMNMEKFNLVRVYVGLENPDLLIEDLAQALQKIKM